ncbi:lactonase family protein [Polaromonas jejuensis]|uniref:Lactonase family protein n=1 Tax=Polaromonas jejuensis TaxID=457502 RepID=A0ABW0QDL9_9BURK|nr:YncE family protein [Polaromonas jejuensis]
MKKPARAIAWFAAALVGLSALPAAHAADPAYMIVGNDEKVTWDENGRIRFLPPGQDSVQIFDIGRNPAMPQLVATLKLDNSIFGPPTNLAVAPDQRFAYITNPMAWNKDGEAWKPAPDNKLNVIDLGANPPKVVDTVTVGRQPSGMAISRDGRMGLVANRADNSVTVLNIEGGRVSVSDTVAIGEHVVAVSFAADGKRAFVVKMNANALGVIHFDNGKASYDKKNDIGVGVTPYNVAVTPDGRLALSLDMGNPNASDGHVDTISVVDLEASPPRTIDKVVVDDGPEGLAVSPTGRHAAVALIRGSNNDRKSWFYHPKGSVALLKIDGRKVSKVAEVEVGALPEGVVFSPDGQYLYVGNFLDGDISVLRVDGDRLKDTGQRIKLPGHPAAMRAVAY